MGFCFFSGESFFLGSNWTLSLPVCSRSLGHYRDRTRDARGTLRLSAGAISHLLHTCAAKEATVPCPFPFQPSVFPVSTRWHMWGGILSVFEQTGLKNFRHYKLDLAHFWPLWTYSHFSWFLKICLCGSHHCLSWFRKDESIVLFWSFWV